MCECDCLVTKAPRKWSIEEIRAGMDEARKRQTVVHLRKTEPNKFAIGAISILIPLSMGGLIFAMLFG